MIMVVKYQIFSCQKPTDLITITDNHFMSILEMLDQCNINETEEDAVQLVASVRNQFLFHYHTMDLITLQLVRYNILNFLKDVLTRVSIFLREQIQTNEGKFVIPVDRMKVECECQIPGVIRYFRGIENEIIQTNTFDVEGEYVVCDTRTELGLNM